MYASFYWERKQREIARDKYPGYRDDTWQGSQFVQRRRSRNADTSWTASHCRCIVRQCPRKPLQQTFNKHSTAQLYNSAAFNCMALKRPLMIQLPRFIQHFVYVASRLGLLNILYFHYTVFQKKTPTHIIGYKLRNSCLILIIFDIKIPHIIWHRMTARWGGQLSCRMMSNYVRNFGVKNY